MHTNSKLLFEKHAKPLFKSGMRVLEIGPAGIPSTYSKVVNDPSIVWDTIELFHFAGLTYVAKGEYEFPIPSDTYDIVLSGQVIEHVRKIWLWIRELSRVCKPGGLVITINPVSWPYHEAPIDCWRIYPDGMKALYEEGGLTMKTSVYESLQPHQITTLHLLKQIVKPLVGRKRVVNGPVIDTVSIGVKN